MSRRITFPHAGDYYLAIGHLFRKLGYEVIIPPKTSQRALDLGEKYAPEQACLPFKLTLGNLIEAIEEGADVVAMVGGRTGMCRLAFYSELYRKILTENGFEVEFVPLKLKKEFWLAVKRHLPELKSATFLLALIEMLLKMRGLEAIRTGYLDHHPREAMPGACHRLVQQMKVELQEVDIFWKILGFPEKVRREFKKIPLRDTPDLITVGYLGEFFMTIDQFGTHRIEEYLGSLGVRVVPADGFSDFFIGSFKLLKIFDRFLPTHKHQVHKLAKPFLNLVIGGHAVESIGQSIWFAKNGIDGVIHVYPFGCMPEIVATSILPTVSEAHEIPILSLCFDEQTGEAGIRTRIEAFVDMIKRKKAGY
ncbi:MAG TPA: acyl-CoA dehydratase activase-related protein [Chroococcales cyanobacterium]|jgi:predicted nucleotide-binding protein (sugar kinase/HSP70/actin superfamily)